VIDPVAWMKTNAASEFSRVVVGKTCDPLAANVKTCSDTDFADNASLIATADSVPPTIGIAGSIVSEPESRIVCGVDTMAIGTYLNGFGCGFIGMEASIGRWTALYLPYSASYTSFTVLSSPACFTDSDIGMCGMCNSYLNGLACGVAGIEGLISFGTTSL
jgi:hypothetical protein